MIYSFSRLALYELCPFRFYLKYVMKRDEPITIPLALGKATHRGIECIVQTGCSVEEAVMEGLIAADFYPISRTDLVWLIRSAPVYKGMGKTETHFTLSLGDSSSSPKIQGYIDLEMEDSFVDWKTGRVPYGIWDTMQIPLYAWAILKQRPIQSVKGSLYFLRYRKWVTETFDRSLAERGRKWAYDLAMRIEQAQFLLEQFPDRVNEIYPAKPSHRCKDCPFALECYQTFKK
ncbi:PD-(D/E)XK nuclease family protein [Brevibacillus marinus]|uniref:PD-(D/E)XK nuclease family protein n=1 Tax=Brevibacillus marinus TaxID=2496837 RepID=UPI000F84A97E|nr:PD-(D/E)XK nuclease family protein [Brevibacillus marinus]